MTDQTSNPTPDETTPSDESEIVEPNRLQRFVLNHPRAARFIAIGGGVVAVGGTVAVANTVRKNKAHVSAAGEHLVEAGHEISTAVSPTSETTEA